MAKATRTSYSKRTEFWAVGPASNKKIIKKAAVRNSLGQFGGATNYRVGATVKGARIEG